MFQAILQHDFWRVQMRYFQFLDPETCNRIVQTLVNQGRLRPHQLHIFSQCTTQLKLMALGLKVQQWVRAASQLPYVGLMTSACITGVPPAPQPQATHAPDGV